MFRAVKALSWSTLIVAGSLLAGCGDRSEDQPKEESVTADEARDITQEVRDYYAANSDFFTFSTPDQIPDDLTWENGMDEPDLGSPNAKKGGTRNVQLQDFPRTLRKVGPDSNGSFRPYILDDVELHSAKLHPNTGRFFPMLATEWAISKERKTVYVRLNPKATWSDGEPLNVDDFMFMFFFYQSKYILAPWYNEWYSKQYANITKYDDHTFSITVPKARPDMAQRVLELTPQPEHFYKELGDDFPERYQWRFAPTTGPYVIDPDKDVKKGRSIVMHRNDNWWAKDNKFMRNRYNTDKLRFTVIRDTAKAFEAFKRGDMDAFGLNLAEYWYDKLPDDDPDVANGYIHKSTFYNMRPRPMYGLYMNTDKKFLDNKDIRKGIQHATNFQLVIDKFFRGDYVRLNTFWEGYGKFTHPDIKAREYDIDKALEYFAKAGFTERGPDGILVNAEGERLSFTLTNGYESLKDLPTILREEAAKAGLDFRIDQLDSTSAWKKNQEKKIEISFTAFGPSNQPFPRFWEFFHSANAYDVAFLEDGSVNPNRKLKPQTNNFFAYARQDVDEWITKYRSSEDEDEMLQLARNIQETVHEDAVFVPGFVMPFYRVGHWRWMNYPEDFNVKASETAGEFRLHWVDDEVKAETLEARRAGDPFEPQINVYDQYFEQ